MKLRLLGQRTPRAFLQRHWQKRPLFVRGALPGFRGVADARALAALAARDDVESRIVVRRAGRFPVEHGPFRRLRMPERNFTLLVSGVNLHLQAADALLRRFDFVPQARLDDVMVSYAAPGGGVGPHVDSYDVFLLQGPGRRRWSVWNSRNEVTRYECGPGDLLYVPPGWKHDGVALDPCFTYSIGFRAPEGAELGARFLDWLHERGLPGTRYRDPGLAPAKRPAQIPEGMVRFSREVMERISWTGAEVARFLGQYLTEPKPHVVFKRSPRRRPLAGSEVELDPKTQLLYRGAELFINGEVLLPPRKQASLLRELADRRRLDGRRAAASGLGELFYDWQRAGFLHLKKARPQ
jgi:50S ribosomal protein L16 3-hydroxylase